MKRFSNSLAVLILIISSQFAVQAQDTKGSLTGTVSDPNGAVVPSATVTVKNNATGEERTATTNESGQFNIAALTPGTYTVAVEGTGFKRTVAPNIVVQVSQVAEVTITMEVGLASETVTVTAAQEVINTTNPSITNVINTRQVVDLPLPTRNPLDLAGLQAGIAVTGTDVRGSSIGGLRQTATNVTQDGINAMDNFVKTSSLFALSSPSLNSVSEFSITTNTVGSDQGRGVGQVNTVTRSGSNEFHGGVFYMHRNDAFEANTFFNNLSGTPRTIEKQHFFGGDIGGPVSFLNFGEGVPTVWNGRDKAFFFFSYEGFRENFQVTRNRTVLTPEARQGVFRYVGGNGQIQTVNLLNLGRINTLNPITTGIINATPAPNNTLVGDGLNTAGYRFNVTGTDPNDKYVFRYDHQLVKDTGYGAHKFEFVFNRAHFLISPDTFNALEALFPGGENAVQESTRWLITPALVSTFGNATNVFRYGRQWAAPGFLRENAPTAPFIVFSGITTPDNQFMSQGRRVVVDQYKDDFTKPMGDHLFRFGADYQKIFAESFNDAGINQLINLGTNSANSSGITASQFPNLPAGATGNAIVTRAEQVYVNLVGNLGTSSRTFNVTSPDSGFVAGATRLRLLKEHDLALYGQDQWRVWQNLTLNYGLRWDWMGVPTVPDGVAIQPTNACDIYGVSGCGNIFKPNAPAGAPPAVATLDFVSGSTGKKLFNDDWNNFAPFVGIAWSPDFKNSLMRGIFGSEGRSSIRLGYSISYLHDGFTVISNVLGVGTTNPGLIQTSANNTPTGVLASSGVSLTTPTFSIPITDRANFLANNNNGVFTFDPNLRTPYVHQWSIGFEREILPNTAFEIRYVGNYAKGAWRAYSVNEVNIFENGFLQEFLNAQKNLALRGGTSFAPGCAGCAATPLLDKLFGGLAAGSGYSSSTFISNLNNNNVGAMAFTLANSTTYRGNRENAANGIPANFFLANPNASFAQILTNESASNYNALEVELRRRFSQGFQFQANYTFSKALTNAADAFGNNQNDLSSWRTLRDKDLDWRRSNQDQTHRFVANGLYELPFGRGKYFFSDAHPVVDQILGGWTIGAIVTWQTRPPFFIASNRSTVNQLNPGNNPAQLVGISFEEFKKNLGIYKTSTGVYFINPDLLNITTNPTTGAFVSSTLKAGLLGAPPPGQFGNFPLNSLNGPRYFNVDMSVVKRFPVGERVRLELKSTFINVLNHPNFVFGTQNFDDTGFGRITGQSGNQRIIHFEGRVRF